MGREVRGGRGGVQGDVRERKSTEKSGEREMFMR